MNVRITHIGTATLLLELGDLRLLTDPVFDPPGGTYAFGWGTGSTKLTAPAVPGEALGTMDAKDGVRATKKLRPHTVIPIHYEGWKHFSEGRRDVEQAFLTGGLQEKLLWLPLGVPTVVEV